MNTSRPLSILMAGVLAAALAGCGATGGPRETGGTVIGGVLGGALGSQVGGGTLP
jgi:hypothetical protein